MPVTPNFLERLLLFRLNRGPAPILDLFGAAGFEAVGVAIERDLFETLADGDATPSEIADESDADEHAIRRLLELLATHGYVTESGGRYRNTAMTRKWLTDAEGTNMGPWFTFWRELVFPFWDEYLERVIDEGEPPLTLYDWVDDQPDGWETTQRGFRAAASVLVDDVTDAVSVPANATNLLDVGGGHGLYAIELCRRTPDLSATIFDDPAALDVARDEIDAADLGNRVRVEGGDYATDDLGTGYDLALLFNVIHAHDEAETVALFERVADALAPGGSIAILDQFEGTGRTPVGRAGVAFVGLTYLVTLAGEVHDDEAVMGWLRKAGFTDVSRTAIRSAGPGNSVIQATKR